MRPALHHNDGGRMDGATQWADQDGDGCHGDGKSRNASPIASSHALASAGPHLPERLRDFIPKGRGIHRTDIDKKA
jgi:hypothetical protein